MTAAPGRSGGRGCSGHRTGGRRRRARGQAVVLFAIMGVAVIGIAGLALDGGVEMGAYRVTQSAADSGALAAARDLFKSAGGDSSATMCNYSSTEVVHNKSTQSSCTADTIESMQPGPGKYTADAAVATTSATINALVATITASTGVGDSIGTAASTPKATGYLDLANIGATATVAGLPVSVSSLLYNCSTSATADGTTSYQPAAAASNCSGTSTSLSASLAGINIGTTLGFSVPTPASVLQQSSVSSVSSTGVPSFRNEETIGSASANLESSVSLGAYTANTATSNSYSGSTSAVTATTNIASVTVTLPGAGLSHNTLSLSGVTVQAKVSWDPVHHYQTTTSCKAASITLNGTALTNVPCSSLLPYLNVGGIVSVGSTSTTTCSGTTCTASACMFSIGILNAVAPLANVNVCLGSASVSADFSPVYSNGAIVVKAQTPTPTYFLRLLGWRTTYPSATSAAVVLQIDDESSAQFALAPFAVAYTNRPASGSSGLCTSGLLGPLQPGCTYYIWGSNVDQGLLGVSSWTGQLASASAHSQGSTTSPISNTLGGNSCNVDGAPQPMFTGGSYWLLPVIDNGSHQVLFYGLFKIGSDCHQGTLLAEPNSGTGILGLVQAQTTSVWTPMDEGAVATKLVDSSILHSTLGF